MNHSATIKASETAIDRAISSGIKVPDSLFIQLFEHQQRNNLAYQAYLNKIADSDIKHWCNIPPLPTDAFKAKSNPACFSIANQTNLTTFFTSGTTTELKGAHHFRNTRLYENSILHGWKSLSLPALNKNTFILTPDTTEAPHSSLSHMMMTLQKTYCPEAKFVFANGEISELAIEQIQQAIKADEPITLLGTALAFLTLFEKLDTLKTPSLTLPPGSWAMETGGYKGSKKSLTKEELYQLFESHLGIQSENIWNEYSMTELSSQFYTKGIGNPHHGPEWTRIKVINPETLETVEPGEIGYLVIYDLANYDSCMAIMTQDLAIYHDEKSFTLIGRDPSALARGCSRTV